MLVQDGLLSKNLTALWKTCFISKVHFPQVKRNLQTQPNLLTLFLWSGSDVRVWVLSVVELLKPCLYFTADILSYPELFRCMNDAFIPLGETPCCYTNRFIFQLHRDIITVLHLFFYPATHQNVNNEWSFCVCKAPTPNRRWSAVCFDYTDCRYS